MDELFAHTREIRSGSGSGSRSRSRSRTSSAPRRRSSTLHPALLKAELRESASSKLRRRYYEDVSPSPSPSPSPSLSLPEPKLILPHRYENRHSERIPSPNIIINADPEVFDEKCTLTERRESPSARKKEVAIRECVDIQSLLSQWTTLSPREIARGNI
jgi:hypothetical protein